MHFTVGAFRSTPPFDILAKLFGQPEHTDWLDESMSWKQTCYIGDWSFLPQTRFRGPGVPELFSGISVNCFRKFPPGASKHVVRTNTHGHVMSEGILTRLDEEDYVFHGPGDDWARYNLEHRDFKATAETRTGSCTRSPAPPRSRCCWKERLGKPARVLRTLVWNSDDVLDVHRSLYGDGPHPTFMDMPRDLRGHLWMDRVERDGVLAGTATSRGYSYYFRKMLSLAVLNVADAGIGTQVDVVWGDPGDPVKRIRATVAKAPFKRVRSRAELHAHLAAYRAESGPTA
ncbi:hypothetical protein [Streptomyces sp. ME18-1-4]|uniref:hypothetical protein n=1 Tax=Streptomyces sp. ME18-1-4 TaxID=3028685 RepID=UPI0029BE72B3|nr:hypothetical protein [Streptomyces sp. ME18-1-4]MDX3245684.1 hypothetical protein [Streptomyces sp. ME18-1-4]